MPAVDKLIRGYQRFKESYYEQNKQKLSKLAKQGQSPKIAIISCSDSRVDPTIILDCEPGDLFVIRNVANLIPPCESCDSFHGTSAAIEYAVTGLEVESIIVLGHTQCGGIKALIDTPPSSTSETFVSKWMKQLEGVRNEVLEHNHKTPDACYHECEEKGIIHSLNNLMTFPWVKERVEAGSLHLHGWHYDLDNGALYAKRKDSDEFEQIS
jgi:carbonic anhydrase